MTNASTRKSSAVKKSPLTLAGVGHGLQGWLVRNRFYVIAFFIPVVLTFLAYALFGIAPFGEESVLCLDLNGQYVYYFEALRDAFWGDGSIFYNWSRNLSGNFMGIIGYYLASPFTLIVILLPERCILASLLIMQLCKLGAAGVTFSYFLQKRRDVGGLHALLFSSMYAMMAYAVIQLIDPMWIDGLVFLPLIMTGLEYLVDDGRKINYAIPLALMFVANFYIGFMMAIFIVIYFIFYLFFGTDQKGRKASDFLRQIGRMCYTTVVGLLCSAIMILPVYYALQQGKFEFTESIFTQLSDVFHSEVAFSEKMSQLKDLFEAQFDLIDLIPQLLPAQYDSVNVQGSPEIYCGLLTVVLLPLFYANSKITLRKKIGYTFMLVCMIVSMYFKPIDMMWHGGQSPNWLPYRYSFMISFILLSMAAMAFTKLKDIRPGALGVVFFGMMVLLLVIAKLGYEHIDTIKSIWVSIVLIGVYLICLYLMKDGSKDAVKRFANVVVTIVMLFFVGGELTYNAVDSMNKIDDEVAYSTKKSWTNFIENGRAVVDELEEYDDGLYRSEKTYFRCVNDNAAMGLRGISHSSSVMNTKIINFIETLGYCMHSYYTRYDGNTALADSLLGIKYVLNKESDTNKRLNPTYEAVMQYDYTDENDTAQTIKVYENPNALSIGYMVDEDVERIDHLGNDNPFNSQNMLMSVISGNMTFDESGSISGSKSYYTPVELDGDPVLSNVTTSAYGDQTCYTAGQSGDPTVDFRLTVQTEDPIYIFFKTENQKAVNLWLGEWNAETADYDFEWFNAYFEGDNYTIMRLGQFDIGTNLCLRMTVANEYTIVKNFFFYSFDEEMFQEDIDKLKENQWEITEYNDRKITGTITAEEGQIMMTSIPWEKGWTVKVDGKKVEPVEVLNALVGVELEAGEHVVTMTYTPPGWNIGLICLVIGICILVLFYRYDKKHNKVLLAIVKEKRKAAIEEQQKPAKKAEKKTEIPDSQKPKAPDKPKDVDKPKDTEKPDKPEKSNEPETETVEKPETSEETDETDKPEETQA